MPHLLETHLECKPQRGHCNNETKCLVDQLRRLLHCVLICSVVFGRHGRVALIWCRAKVEMGDEIKDNANQLQDEVYISPRPAHTFDCHSNDVTLTNLQDLLVSTLHWNKVF